MKCAACSGTGEIVTCTKCDKLIVGQQYYIKDYGANREWGPYCADCIALIHKPELDESITIQHSRTRPTEPPNPPEFCNALNLDSIPCHLSWGHEGKCNWSARRCPNISIGGQCLGIEMHQGDCQYEEKKA